MSAQHTPEPWYVGSFVTEVAEHLSDPGTDAVFEAMHRANVITIYIQIATIVTMCAGMVLMFIWATGK